jgi:hypothetical protein
MRGYGGLVTKFFASSVFTLLGRLVYGAYLVHIMLMYILYGSSNKKTDWYESCL